MRRPPGSTTRRPGCFRLPVGWRGFGKSGWLLLVLAVLLAPSVSAKPLQIMLLGDSLTSPENGQRSYRYFLWERLAETGLEFDFVGTRHDPARRSVWTATAGLQFDPDHEGHPSYRIDHVLNGRNDGRGTLESWLDAYTPDVAVVLLGTHDALQGHETEWSVREMRRVIEILRRDNERVAILLAAPPPVDPSHEYAELLIELADAFTELAQRETTVQSPVRLVDLYSSYDPRTMLNAEGNRPNSVGHRLIAERLASSLMLLDEAHLAPVRPTTARLWGAVLVVPLGAALGFFWLARTQLRREKAAQEYAAPATSQTSRSSGAGSITPRASRVSG
ncbi:MAG: GDSL-type esterase/lipase family protein [Planctomycetota bacterium]